MQIVHLGGDPSEQWWEQEGNTGKERKEVQEVFVSWAAGVQCHGGLGEITNVLPELFYPRVEGAGVFI